MTASSALATVSLATPGYFAALTTSIHALRDRRRPRAVGPDRPGPPLLAMRLTTLTPLLDALLREHLHTALGAEQHAETVVADSEDEALHDRFSARCGSRARERRRSVGVRIGAPKRTTL